MLCYYVTTKTTTCMYALTYIQLLLLKTIPGTVFKAPLATYMCCYIYPHSVVVGKSLTQLFLRRILLFMLWRFCCYPLKSSDFTTIFSIFIYIIVIVTDSKDCYLIIHEQLNINIRKQGTKIYMLQVLTRLCYYTVGTERCNTTIVMAFV